METLRVAMEAVQRNLVPLGIYVAIAVLLTAFAQTVTILLGGPFDNPYENPLLIAYGIGMDVALVVAFAASQAVVFSRMGKQIDRPLWKIDGDWEALKRYFGLWVVLNLLPSVLRELANFSVAELENVNLAGMFFVLLTFSAVIYIPVGAAIMFAGKVSVAELGESLRPLIRQVPKTLVILLFAGMVFFFSYYMMAVTASARWLWPLVSIVEAYFDCVVFAAVWLICMYDRQNPEENDLDF